MQPASQLPPARPTLQGRCKAQVITEVTGLGYDLLFSDVDALVLRDPFPYLNQASPFADRHGAPLLGASLGFLLGTSLGFLLGTSLGFLFGPAFVYAGAAEPGWSLPCGAVPRGRHPMFHWTTGANQEAWVSGCC